MGLDASGKAGRHAEHRSFYAFGRLIEVSSYSLVCCQALLKVERFGLSRVVLQGVVCY